MNAPRVRLRDVTLADADQLDAWSADPPPFNDFGGPRGPVDREALAAGPLRNERNGVLIIEVIEMEPGRSAPSRGIGSATGRPAASDALNMGVELVPTRAATASGSRPRRCSRVTCSRTPPSNRVEAQTDIDNIAEQRALEKAGFIREGVLRGTQFRAGAYHDLVSYSVLRAEVEGD